MHHFWCFEIGQGRAFAASFEQMPWKEESFGNDCQCSTFRYGWRGDRVGNGRKRSTIAVCLYFYSMMSQNVHNHCLLWDTSSAMKFTSCENWQTGQREQLSADCINNFTTAELCGFMWWQSSRDDEKESGFITLVKEISLSAFLPLVFSTEAAASENYTPT